MFRTLPSREELARLDSFALGEAVTARLRAMTGAELRAFATSTAARSDGYYKAELSRALQENPTDDEVLRDSLSAFFRQNPRAIERCEPPFIAAVLSALSWPEGDVAIDEDKERRPKPLLLGAGIALLLFGAGAAMDRATTLLHPAAQAAAPAAIVVYVTPQPAARPVKHAPPHRRAAIRPPGARPHRTVVAAAPPRRIRSHAQSKKHPVAVRHPAPARRATAPAHVKHVAVRPAGSTPTPMSAESLTVDSTPKPRSWLQRQFDHLNPFKHRSKKGDG